MALLNVNPTRMEFTRLKRQLGIAKRGHKLLKDKQDEMVRQFMMIIRRTRDIRNDVEDKLRIIMRAFSSAKLKMSYQGIMEALMIPASDVEINPRIKNIMSIKAPDIEYVAKEDMELTYGFAFTPGELDEAVLDLGALLPKLVELASLEKTCDMLADEIEKTRRRVNAIEYVMVPNLTDTIKYIRMKLEDNERSNVIRLLKSKEIILAKNNN